MNGFRGINDYARAGRRTAAAAVGLARRSRRCGGARPRGRTGAERASGDRKARRRRCRDDHRDGGACRGGIDWNPVWRVRLTAGGC
ncbi:hypothetical protein BJF79_09095 [Actinomadura sp. CNU-125]|nr:hypothetical protein BJF79_09095 [Actinomadura sp. CNU-125]